MSSRHIFRSPTTPPDDTGPAPEVEGECYWTVGVEDRDGLAHIHRGYVVLPGGEKVDLTEYLRHNDEVLEACRLAGWEV